MSMGFPPAQDGLPDTPVIAVSGHRRLSARAETTLEEVLGRLWRTLGQEWSACGRNEAPPLIANGLAVGADLLFAETRKRDFPAAKDWHVLPCSPALFEATLFDGLEVRPDATAGLRARYHRATDGATRQTVICDTSEPPTSLSYAELARWMVTAADGLLAYWDGEEPRGEGGTGHVVELACERALPVLLVTPDGEVRGDGAMAGKTDDLQALSREFVCMTLRQFDRREELAAARAGE